jgi:hypothetical protein
MVTPDIRSSGPVLHRASRRTFLIALAAAYALPARADEPAAAGPEPEPEPSPQQVAPNTYVLRGGAAGPNGGLVVTNSSVVLIGAPPTAAQAASWLAQARRVTPKPVSHVLLLAQPSGEEAAVGLAALKVAGTTIVARRSPQPPAQADDAPPARAAGGLWLEDSTDLLIGGLQIQAQVLASAPGGNEMVCLLPDEAVLFVGGLVVPAGIPELGAADTRQWIAALDELLRLDARVLVAATGAPTSLPAQDLQATRDYLALLRWTMGQALREGEAFDTAYDKADWGRFSELPQFGVINRANASATYGQMQREVD